MPRNGSCCMHRRTAPAARHQQVVWHDPCHQRAAPPPPDKHTSEIIYSYLGSPVFHSRRCPAPGVNHDGYATVTRCNEPCSCCRDLHQPHQNHPHSQPTVHGLPLRFRVCACYQGDVLSTCTGRIIRGEAVRVCIGVWVGFGQGWVKAQAVRQSGCEAARQ